MSSVHAASGWRHPSESLLVAVRRNPLGVRRPSAKPRQLSVHCRHTPRLGRTLNLMILLQHEWSWDRGWLHPKARRRQSRYGFGQGIRGRG